MTNANTIHDTATNRTRMIVAKTPRKETAKTTGIIITPTIIVITFLIVAVSIGILKTTTFQITIVLPVRIHTINMTRKTELKTFPINIQMMVFTTAGHLFDQLSDEDSDDIGKDGSYNNDQGTDNIRIRSGVHAGDDSNR